MTYNIVIKPEARADIKESFIWYEDQIEGLGHEFRFELSRTLARIKSNPAAFPEVYRSARRALINRFPHNFYFFIESEDIVVIACTHQKRHQRAWKRRIE